MLSKMAEAIELRQNGKPEEAEEVLAGLLATNPENPNLNYQMAWTCDVQGKEADAVPYYERAIAKGLVEDRAGAMLGLGSTYRCLGEFDKSLKVLNQAIEEFPEERALKVFRALTLLNAGRADQAVGELMVQLLETTDDASIRSYEGALRFYAERPNETWS